jgi:hypothetical protein
MKAAAYFVGLLIAFAGGWGSTILASLLLLKAARLAGERVATWDMPMLALVAFGLAAVLGVFAGYVFVASLSKMP